jgi:hypothetical protein
VKKSRKAAFDPKIFLAKVGDGKTTAMLWFRYPTDFKSVFPVFRDDQVHVRAL